MPGGESLRARAARATFVTTVLIALIVVGAARAPAVSSTISGVAFQDINGDGVMQPTELPWVGHRIYLLDGNGGYLANTLTDALGRYEFRGLVDGAYIVRYRSGDWWKLWEEWVPTTTGSVWPEVRVELSDAAAVDFGWRPIVWSTDIWKPISSYSAPSGLRVHSYNDAVSAREVYDQLMTGGLFGDEQATTTIRFAHTGNSYCVASVVGSPGTYSNFVANCYVSYLSWLQFHDVTLFHEYGHAWAAYHTYIVQQDPSVTEYLLARGIDPYDERLGSTHAWMRQEILAEDYRQLFGSQTAQAKVQENRDIPLAADVPGLREYLTTTFMGIQPDDDGSSEPAADEPGSGGSEEPDATSEPDPEQDPEPEPSATASAVHVGDLSGSATKVNGKTWRATVSVLVHVDAQTPVADATVAFVWSAGKKDSGSLSCTTGGDGSCQVAVDVANKNQAVTFTVADVAADGSVYDRDGNHASDGDGTVITVARPS